MSTPPASDIPEAFQPPLTPHMESKDTDNNAISRKKAPVDAEGGNRTRTATEARPKIQEGSVVPSSSASMIPPKSEPGIEHVNMDLDHEARGNPGDVREKVGVESSASSSVPCDMTGTSEDTLRQTGIATDRMDPIIATTNHEETDEARAVQRKSLTDLYSPFVSDSDTCLEDARNRLQYAIEQTRELRAAFTDQVYRKYRVRLKPPPSSTQRILNDIRANPKTIHDQVKEQIKHYRVEKELERKEAQKLNAEWKASAQVSKTSAPTTLSRMNADNAEQLMYVSAGLSLVILPEDDATEVGLRSYEARANDQQTKGISTIAATAREIMLDRTRKAATMKKERDQLCKEGRNTGSRNDSFGLSILSQNIGSTDAAGLPTAVTVHGSNKTEVSAATAGLIERKSSLSRLNSVPKLSGGFGKISSSLHSTESKQLRARIQASMTSQTLLSLQPTAEELGNDGKLSAATMYLVERGIGTIASSSRGSQHRLKHPFPESLAARRRGVNPGLLKRELEKVPASTQTGHPFFQSVNPELNLPLEPTNKERRSKQRSLVSDSKRACTPRAKVALESILNQFVALEEGKRPKKQHLAEINFLHGLQNFREPRDSSDGAASSTLTSTHTKSQPIDSTLALNVLQSIGFIKSMTKAEEPGISRFDETIFDDSVIQAFEAANGASDGSSQGRQSVARLKYLSEKIRSRKRSFVDAFFSKDDCGGNLSLNATQPINANSRFHAEAKSKGAGAQCAARSTITSADLTILATDDTIPASIRGGGEEESTGSSENNDRHDSLEKVQPAAAGDSIPTPNQTAQKNVAPPEAADTNSAGSANETTAHQNVANNNPRRGQHPWEDNRLSSTGSRFPTAHYQRATPNTLQISQPSNLPNTRILQSERGDMTEYLGNIHQGPYDWMAQGAVSSPGIANAPNSLSVLGMHNHRAFYSMHERSRMLMARDSHIVASAGATNTHRPGLGYMGGYMQPPNNRHFQHLLSSTGSMIGQSGMQHPASSPMVNAKPDSRSAQNKCSKPSANSQLLGNKDSTLESQSNNGSQTGTKRKQPFDETDSRKALHRRPSGSRGNENADRLDMIKEDKTTTPSRLSSEQASADIKEKNNGTDKVFVSSMRPNSVSSTGEMRFFVPPAPKDIPDKVARSVVAAAVHEAVETFEADNKTATGTALVEYIVAVGTAVPIPKALVAHQLKEKINAQAVKNGGNSGLQSLTREVIVATLLLWLWNNHEECFQRAFAKSGRIDVDPECKWLILHTVETAVRALILEVSDPANVKGNPLSTLLSASRARTSNQKNHFSKEADRLQSTGKIDLTVASVVSRSLLSNLTIDSDTDSALPHFHDLIQYLDDSRKCALQSKARERALLATLISRKATMSLPFSHAYVSSMVRAGEALGHGNLFEIVQDEDLGISTMIPYDVFTDENGAWEDPCRPSQGYTNGVTGDDLMRRAHARAMIQKSLKKLQDRHFVRGGTLLPGPYIDPPTAQSPATLTKGSPATTPRGSIKRQRSFSEPPIQPGTGSAQATTWSLYEPRHYAAALVWDQEEVESSPYGKHDNSKRPRSLSVAQYAISHDRNKTRNKANTSIGKSIPIPSTSNENKSGHESTREIEWADIAGIFQNVTLPGLTQAKKEKEQASAAKAKHIFAPIIRRLNISEQGSSDDEEKMVEDEDLSDDAVLRRHQSVLDEMKEKLSKILEARKKLQESRRSSLKK